MIGPRPDLGRDPVPRALNAGKTPVSGRDVEGGGRAASIKLSITRRRD